MLASQCAPFRSCVLVGSRKTDIKGRRVQLTLYTLLWQSTSTAGTADVTFAMKKENPHMPVNAEVRTGLHTLKINVGCDIELPPSCLRVRDIVDGVAYAPHRCCGDYHWPGLCSKECW